MFFHGVNAVYKFPPYELYPAPGKSWNFSASDASLMARLGFNVVRLGMTWSRLEPGTAPATPNLAVAEPFWVKRSSGSAVAFPTMVTVQSGIVVPILGGGSSEVIPRDSRSDNWCFGARAQSAFAHSYALAHGGRYRCGWVVTSGSQRHACVR